MTENAGKNTKPDIRQTSTCAALATITTLGMFSLIANVMTPMFANIHLPVRSLSVQEIRADPANIEDKVCVQTAHVDSAERLQKLSII